MSVRARLAALGASLCSVALVSCPAADRARNAVPAPAAGLSVASPAAPRVQPRAVLQPAVDQLPAAERGSWPAPTPEQVHELGADALQADRTLASDTVPASLEQDSDVDPRQGLGPAAAIAPARGSLDPDRALAATAKETWVYASPAFGATKLGYLRAGAIVRRSAEPVGFEHCAAGWYRIAPDGYVCVGKAATLDLDAPIVRETRTRPDRTAPLPYRYGQSRFPTPPYYTRVPTPREQAATEDDLARHPHAAGSGGWADVPLDPVPDFLAGGQPSPWFGGTTRSALSVASGRAVVKSGFAFVSFFDAGGRRFGLTTDLDIMPLDRLKPVEPSTFHGLALVGGVTLPVVFVRAHGAWLYDGDPRTTGLKQNRQLGFREAVPISGKSVRAGKTVYLETRDGQWLVDDHLVRVDPMRHRPGWATPGRTWIDVSILRQALVAYEGTRPVYVTLVSTGVDGLGDPEKTHSTVRGQFLIHTKHVSVTMDGDEVGDEFDLRDVPWVQYFTQGYALHAAYWHNTFGQPHSHGCVNLAPIDARWLFEWTDPPVPEAWHGALSLHDGTLVSIHP